LLDIPLFMQTVGPKMPRNRVILEIMGERFLDHGVVIDTNSVEFFVYVQNKTVDLTSCREL